MPVAPVVQNYLPEVRNQYEQYPYPFRDPEDEKTIFRFTSMDALAHLNHYGFEGKYDHSQGMRVLVAGGGTGDALITLAEQLRDTPSEIVYLDISQASQEVARKRAAIRNLTNITWVHGSLLDVADLQLGRFDYINCSGVLHHLAEPDVGLAALTRVLNETGVLGLMLYAPYGREGIYRMQTIMRMLNKHTPDMRARVDNCKPLLDHLMADWMRHVKARFRDIKLFGDIGIYDMFLHSQDRAYSVPQLYDFLKSAKLHLHHFCAEPKREGQRRYVPEYYVNEPHFLSLLEPLTTPEKQALAELLNGQIEKHMVYATKKIKAMPGLDNLENIPFLAQFFEEAVYGKLGELIAQTPQDGLVDIVIEVAGEKNMIRFNNTPHAADIFRQLDGMRTLGSIFSHVQKAITPDQTPPSTSQLQKEFKTIYEAFALQDCMFLRHQSVPRFRNSHQLQQVVKDMYAN